MFYCKNNLEYGDPTGIRTPVTAVKGRCPRPLDDRVNKLRQTLKRNHQINGDPTGIRTPVTAVKGRCPRPLDDRVVSEVGVY